MSEKSGCGCGCNGAPGGCGGHAKEGQGHGHEEAPPIPASPMAAETLTAAGEPGMVWRQRADGVWHASGDDGVYYAQPTPSGQYRVIWMGRRGNQREFPGLFSLSRAMQIGNQGHNIAAEANENAWGMKWERSGGGTGWRGTDSWGTTYLLRQAGNGQWNIHVRGRQYGPYASLDEAKRAVDHTISLDVNDAGQEGLRATEELPGVDPTSRVAQRAAQRALLQARVHYGMLKRIPSLPSEKQYIAYEGFDTSTPVVARVTVHADRTTIHLPNAPTQHMLGGWSGMAAEASAPAAAEATFPNPLSWNISSGGTGWTATGASGQTYLLRRASRGKYNLHVNGRQWGPMSIEEGRDKAAQIERDALAGYRANETSEAAECSVRTVDATGSVTTGCRPWVRMEKDPAAFAACMALANKIGPIEGHDRLYQIVREQMQKEDQEVFYAIVLDTHLGLRAMSEIARGGRDRVPTPMPDVARLAMYQAVHYGGMGLGIAHCHPSGSPKPSSADGEVTKAVQAACESMGIMFVDHLVVGSVTQGYYSFRKKKIFKG